MWLIYLLVIGIAVGFAGGALCSAVGAPQYFEMIAAAGYMLFAGILVFLLHRMAVKLDALPEKKGKGFLWLERIAAAALLAAGLFLRLSQMREEVGESVYLELAYVSSTGQGIPQFSHGIVYFYVWVLRFTFLLLGNKAMAAVGLQIILQMSGVLLLYFAVRKMAGRISAMMLLAFSMLSPYMTGKAITVSPEMLYLFLFALVLFYVSRGLNWSGDWGFWLPAGVLTAVLGYLDVTGFLLVPLMAGVIFSEQKSGEGKRAFSAFGCLAGLVLGAAGCVTVDMLSSGKSAQGIVKAWGELYHWDELQLLVRLPGFDSLWLILFLLCFMVWGIFSFWCHRKTERFSLWMLCVTGVAFLQLWGVFTEEMNGAVYLFFFSTVLAGLGIRESLAVYPLDRQKGEDKVQNQSDQNESDQNKREPSGAEITSQESPSEEKTGDGQEIEWIENPLPLPKKHVRRVMDYKLDPKKEDLDGYDVLVPDNDDFDH